MLTGFIWLTIESTAINHRVNRRRGSSLSALLLLASKEGIYYMEWEVELPFCKLNNLNNTYQHPSRIQLEISLHIM
jgi:hypothetical protein